MHNFEHQWVNINHDLKRDHLGVNGLKLFKAVQYLAYC